MAPTKLKIKGNKAFSLLSIETDEDLSKTWRLMTKVKDALEYGMRLENLSWRLWFMHHLMVHDQKSHSQFKKLSTATTKKLEIEKATNLKSLPVPLYRPKTQETNNIKNVKIPKNIAESSPGTEIVASSSPTNTTDLNADYGNNLQPDYGNDSEIIATVNSTSTNDQSSAELMDLDTLDDNMTLNNNGTNALNSSVNENSPRSLVDIFRFSEVSQDFYLRQYTNDQDPYQVVSLPGVFTPSFDAQAILDPNTQQPTMMLDLNEVLSVHQFYSSDSSEPNSPTEHWYTENVAQNPDMQSNLQFQTLNNPLVGRTSSGLHDAVYVRNTDPTPVNPSHLNISITSMNTPHNTPLNTPLNTPVTGLSNSSLMNSVYLNQFSSDQNNTMTTTSPSCSSTSSIETSTVNARPSANAPSSTSENSRPKKSHSNGEQQCFNCGVTSTPLWRRSANDELLCNACGLYLKLHKMARPKTMKPHIVRKDARDDEASQPVCSNCRTMTTPFKLHHERRPLSMKTDVIKKRQRYENGQAPRRPISVGQSSSSGMNAHQSPSTTPINGGYP
ncbi:2898_t:CDS:2 [Funneliformis geosporum]|uniref:2898_t:CDS:1 n=1 Tax=Funneliformis geosporum TaxID=1117311 RepID=A0A9W4SSX5_9GLOM|nr:2898_t:CDS:2 [Funneliformis geosporum]